MAARQYIPSFPEDIDRNYFGNYLSGFVDGEGYFGLIWSPARNTGVATLVIELRHDDAEILDLIQSYFGCGYLFLREVGKWTPNPKTGLHFSKIRDLAKIVVPHFDAFPLRAKKKNDFAVWRQGVELLYRIRQKRMSKGGHPSGFVAKWTDQNKAEFMALVDLLKETRAYKPPGSDPIPLPKPPSSNGTTHSQSLLFDP